MHWTVNFPIMAVWRIFKKSGENKNKSEHINVP